MLTLDVTVKNFFFTRPLRFLSVSNLARGLAVASFRIPRERVSWIDVEEQRSAYFSSNDPFPFKLVDIAHFINAGIELFINSHARGVLHGLHWPSEKTI